VRQAAAVRGPQPPGCQAAREGMRMCVQGVVVGEGGRASGSGAAGVDGGGAAIAGATAGDGVVKGATAGIECAGMGGA